MATTESNRDRLVSLSNRIKFSKKALRKTVSELIQYKTENPTLEDADAQFYIREQLNRAGAKTRLHDPGSKVVALTSRIGGGRGKTLILYNHVDVAPSGDKNAWKYPPFSGVVKGEVVHGRGASDMKAGLVSALFAFNALSEFDHILPGSVEFVSVLDGEYWGKTPKGWGTLDWLLETGRLKGEGCLSPEPSGVQRICIGETGEYWLNLRCVSKPKHGSFAVYEENVCVKLFRAIDEICRALNERVEPPSEIGQLIKQSVKSLEGETSLAKGKKRFEQTANMLEKYLVNVGLVSGGIMVNTVPDRCETSICFCVPLGGMNSFVTEKIREVLRDPYFSNVVLDPIDKPKIEPAYTSPSSGIIRVVSNAIRNCSGMRASMIVAPSISDANIFRHYGIDTCIYGPGNLDRVHGYNEFVEIKDVMRVATTYVRIILEYLSS